MWRCGCFTAVCLVAALASSACRADAGPVALSGEPAAEEIAGWVDDLADESFQVRRRATIQLTLAGTAAKQPVLEALASSDPEVRRRARQILSVLLPQDLTRRLAEFAAHRDGKTDVDLPGWTRFRQQVGHDEASRNLFVEMMYAEADLLVAAENAPDEVEAFFMERCTELRNAMTARDGAARGEISVGSVAGLYFVATDPRVTINARWANYLNAFSAREPFATDVASGANSQPLRDLITAWFDKGLAADPNTNYQNIIMALRLDMPVGLRLAKSLLTKEGQNAMTRPFAMLAIGKFGDRGDCRLLTPYLEDETPCAGFTRGSRRTTIEVRDVALATLVHLTGRSHAGFGFTDVVEDPTFLFNLRSLGFDDPRDRIEAIRAWKALDAAEPR